MKTTAIYSIDGVNDSKYYQSFTDARSALEGYEHDGGLDFTNEDPTSSARFVKPANVFFPEQVAHIRRHTMVLA